MNMLKTGYEIQYRPVFVKMATKPHTVHRDGGKGDINLETAVQICKSSEATKRQAKDLQGEKVDVIRSEQKYMRGTRGYGKNINREREKFYI
ncbi:hypothetical protein ILUMI_00220 [Ignelater luminosus]|uniref:Uncharacterized protein n=1 Tax=Ignelater luminosus TaxID=2038154 RepID=A0A8K0DGP2_IGNLU|nr:hypothetical protein ILUMI_00220 [Ignelater luminosus]